MERDYRREYEILTTLSEGRPVTQRVLAQRLGIALGLANLYLKRLVRKGYIKITTIPPHRIKYLVTPQGLREKTRLSYEFMLYSLQLYGRARHNLREALEPLAQAGVKQVALYGTGEAAELAYLTLLELGLTPAVFDGVPGARFLGVPVGGPEDLARGTFDRIVMATFDDVSGSVAYLTTLGVRPESLVVLTGGAPPEPGPDAHRAVLVAAGAGPRFGTPHAGGAG
jgi:DNA-binding MarR family transcriptional regulator